LSATQLVIFDCDGVLVDSEPIAIRVDQTILNRLGWSLSLDEIVERFVGRPHSFFTSEIEAHLGRPLPDDWETDYLPLYEAAFIAELVAVEGIADVLDVLNAIRLPTCVASSSSHVAIRRSLDLTGLRHHFDERIYSAQDVAHGKPAPDVFLFAAAGMGAVPRHCVVIEDSVHGVTAARAAGMRVLAFGGGVVPAAALEGPNTTVFAHMRELPDLLDLPAPPGRSAEY
jgi:HAD superfamily hydrolase (TIGR01509 family)